MLLLPLPQTNAATAAFTKSAKTMTTLQSVPGPRLDSHASLAQAAAETATATATHCPASSASAGGGGTEEEQQGAGGPPGTRRRWSITDFEVGR